MDIQISKNFLGKEEDIKKAIENFLADNSNNIYRPTPKTKLKISLEKQPQEISLFSVDYDNQKFFFCFV